MTLVPSSSRAPHLLLGTSSTRCTEKTTSTATLRARLQSQDEEAPTPSSPKRSIFPDVYQQFRACFAIDPSREKGQDGMELHASAMEQLIKAHGEIQSKIDTFAEESSAALSETDALYGNIAYPLSATLCHTDNIPRATVATHLANLKNDICSATEELQKLGEEWDACKQAELEAWKELADESKSLKRGPRDTIANAVAMMASFKAEAQSIVNDKCRILTDLEKEFKTSVQSETLKIMKTMLDDSS
ncbi:Fc.00g032420.m01.CDS01 [Cosmosporella sp. VM-42]